jgi:hypothetical protein
MVFFFVMILWRNRPMREVKTFRNFKERDCSTVAERYRVFPPLPFPCFASLRVLLGYAVITWLRKDDVTSVTSRATIHNAAFSACQIRMIGSALWRRTHGIPLNQIYRHIFSELWFFLHGIISWFFFFVRRVHLSERIMLVQEHPRDMVVC